MSHNLNSHYLRVVVADEEAFTTALFQFVTEPTPARNHMPVIEELHEFAPEMVPVLEHMVIDGVQDRECIAEYVRAAFGYSTDAQLN